jgi:hypothetical protein
VSLNFLRIFGTSSKNIAFSASLLVRAPRYVDAEHMARDGLADMDRDAAAEEGGQEGQPCEVFKEAPIGLRPSVR